MRAAYQVADQAVSGALAEFFSGEESRLVPLRELIENAEPAVDKLIPTASRTTIEAVRTHSAQQIADGRHRSRESGDPGAPGMGHPSKRRPQGATLQVMTALWSRRPAGKPVPQRFGHAPTFAWYRTVKARRWRFGF